MKVLIISILVLLFVSCGNRIEKPDNSTALKCAGNFMLSIYKGKFDQANAIMTQDSGSITCLNKTKFNYNQVFTKDQKKAYKKAGVQFIKTILENKSTYLFELSDPITNHKIPSLKVVEKADGWYVDFAYSCSGNL